MTKFLSRYPDGTAGAALLLLRVCCALLAFHVVGRLSISLAPNVAEAGSAVTALALVTGFGTRFVAFVLAGAAITDTIASSGNIDSVMIAYSAGYASLGLLGPGAYSIDANVFGRRVIRLEPRAPDRGSDD